MNAIDINEKERRQVINVNEKISVRILVIPQKSFNRTILFENLGHAISGSSVLVTDKGLYVLTKTESVSDLLLSIKNIQGVDEAIYS